MQELLKRRLSPEIVEQELQEGGELYQAFNKVFISGIIDEEFTYSHSTAWEDFYMTRVRVKRLSGTDDFVPILVSKFLLGKKIKKSLAGMLVEVAGQFKSYNKPNENGRKTLELFVFAKCINIYENEEEQEECVQNANIVFLDGYICKDPVYRVTPLGREITDLLIAVNRNYNKSDYIPCIAWGRMARFTSELRISDRVQLYGRIQSREYFKRYSQDSELGESRIAYELSISKVRLAQDLRLESK